MDLLAAADRDEEVVGELPDRIWDGGPEHHLREAVMLGGAGARIADGIDGGKAGTLELSGDEVNKAVESDWWHNVNEQTVRMLVYGAFEAVVRRGEYVPCNFIQRMEYQGVPPHGYCYGVVPVRQTICAYE